jgi:N-acetylneuraminate synthase
MVYIIAEAGVNHNGSLDMAKDLIDVAVEAGADAVKFQTFRADQLVIGTASKAEYQLLTTNSYEPQRDMLRRLELDTATHRELIEHCQQRGIQFLSTPFDQESVDLLVGIFDLPYLKLSSGEITNAPLLLKAASTGKPVFLSTGMSTLAEIETALGVLAFGYLRRETAPSLAEFQEAYCSEEGQRRLREKVTLLHCTTEYPAPFVEVNLRAIDTIAAAFGLPVGYSDHTQGIAISIAAVARGAVVIEKHFTLDRNLPGPDHNASLEPGELKRMVQSIRQVEVGLGTGHKFPSSSEQKNKTIVRKSLVASQGIKKGEPFTKNTLLVKRPGTGISPLQYWDILGRKANRDYQEDEVIDL